MAGADGWQSRIRRAIFGKRRNIYNVEDFGSNCDYFRSDLSVGSDIKQIVSAHLQWAAFFNLRLKKNIMNIFHTKKGRAALFWIALKINSREEELC